MINEHHSTGVWLCPRELPGLEEPRLAVSGLDVNSFRRADRRAVGANGSFGRALVIVRVNLSLKGDINRINAASTQPFSAAQAAPKHRRQNRSMFRED